MSKSNSKNSTSRYGKFALYSMIFFLIYLLMLIKVLPAFQFNSKNIHTVHRIHIFTMLTGKQSQRWYNLFVIQSALLFFLVKILIECRLLAGVEMMTFTLSNTMYFPFLFFCSCSFYNTLILLCCVKKYVVVESWDENLISVFSFWHWQKK